MALKYKMFDEMVKEIAEEGMHFESNMTLELQEDLGETEPPLPEWSAKIDLPYGTYECKLVYRPATAVEGDEKWAL